MSAPQTTGISNERAYGLSIALHILAAACIVIASAPFLRASGAIGAANAQMETIRVGIISIAHAARVRPAPRVRAPAPVPVAASVSQRHTAPVVASAVATHNARATRPHRSDVAAEPVGLAVVRRALPTREVPERDTLAAAASPPHDVVAAVVTPAAAAIVSSQPSPVPTAVLVSQTAERSVDVPSGGWGQSFTKPILADDDALVALRAIVTASTTVSIDVDETGRATHVSLPASLSGETRTELEKKLLDMRFVPAECNGLRCTGTLRLTI